MPYLTRRIPTVGVYWFEDKVTRRLHSELNHDELDTVVSGMQTCSLTSLCEYLIRELENRGDL